MDTKKGGLEILFGRCIIVAIWGIHVQFHGGLDFSASHAGSSSPSSSDRCLRCLRDWCFSGFRPSTSCFLQRGSWTIVIHPMVFGKSQKSQQVPLGRHPHHSQEIHDLKDQKLFYPKDPRFRFLYLSLATEKNHFALKVARHQFLQMIEVLGSVSVQHRDPGIWVDGSMVVVTTNSWMCQKLWFAYPFF